MRQMPWRSITTVVVAWFFLVAGSCEGPSREQSVSSASGFQIFVTADPNTVPIALGDAKIGGCSAITVKVFNTSGQLVDGATVNFQKSLGVFLSVTTSGTTVTQTELDADSKATINGLASTTLCAKKQPGTSLVTATVQDASATVRVTFF